MIKFSPPLLQDELVRKFKIVGWVALHSFRDDFQAQYLAPTECLWVSGRADFYC
jgi:hypothetical protein